MGRKRISEMRERGLRGAESERARPRKHGLVRGSKPAVQTAKQSSFLISLYGIFSIAIFFNIKDCFFFISKSFVIHLFLVLKVI